MLALEIEGPRASKQAKTLGEKEINFASELLAGASKRQPHANPTSRALDKAIRCIVCLLGVSYLPLFLKREKNFGFCSEVRPQQLLALVPPL